MKKLISLILALILLVSAVPAFAASSLTTEDVIGTWHIFKTIHDGKTTYGSTTTVQLHADGTGKYASTGVPDAIYSIKWTIERNTVRLTMAKGGRPFISLKRSGSYLLFHSTTDKSKDIKLYYEKVSNTTKKTVTRAILSSGVYQLNNSSKTAAFVSPSPYTKSTALKIPDTIKVNGKSYKVTEIKAKACAGNRLLTAVTLGKNIKTIGAGAFNGCANLKKITFKGTALTKAGSNAFKGIQSAATVTCPKAKLTKYQNLLKKAGIPQAAKFKAK